jgi:Ni,Fe-hydrogenase III small subunit
VDNSAVLNIDFVTHSDKIDVAAHHCLKPDRTVVAHGDIADEGGVFGEKAIFAKGWGEIAAREYKCHVI